MDDTHAPDLAAAELKAMQDSIYREKILRTRRQTPAERFTFLNFPITSSA